MSSVAPGFILLVIFWPPHWIFFLDFSSLTWHASTNIWTQYLKFTKANSHFNDFTRGMTKIRFTTEWCPENIFYTIHSIKYNIINYNTELLVFFDFTTLERTLKSQKQYLITTIRFYCSICSTVKPLFFAGVYFLRISRFSENPRKIAK